MYRVFRAKEIIDETIDTQVSMFSNFFPQFTNDQRSGLNDEFSIILKTFTLHDDTR